MLNFDKTKFLTFLKNISVYVVAVYVFIILGRSIWLNWSLKKQTDQIKIEISALEGQNKNLQNLIVYYRSDSFKELEAREKLGLKKPDEKVVSVPVKKYASTPTLPEELILTSKKANKPIPNWRAWWLYIFE